MGSRVLVILDNDLVDDVRVLKELKIFEKFKIKYFVICYDYGKEYSNRQNILRIKNGVFLKRKLQVVVNSFPLINNIWSKKIKQKIREFDPTHIHVHDLYMLPPVTKALKGNASRPHIVLDLHENYPYAILTYPYANTKFNKILIRPELWAKKEEEILKKADTIIVLDQTFASSLQEKYPSLIEKTFIEFPNYTDNSEFEKEVKHEVEVKLQSPIMLYFGAIGKRRGITKAIQAFSSARKRIPALSFLIIGPLDKDYRKEFTDLLESNVNIQYIPWIKLSQLPYYMEKSTFAIAPFEVNPQIESGIANKIFQYLYGELPVIVSNARPMAALINHSKCGLVYKNHHELQESIYKLSSDPNLLEALKNNCHKVIYDDYRPEKFEKRLLGLYDLSDNQN